MGPYQEEEGGHKGGVMNKYHYIKVNVKIMDGKIYAKLSKQLNKNYIISEMKSKLAMYRICAQQFKGNGNLKKQK